MLNDNFPLPAAIEAAHSPRVDEELYVLSRQYGRTILLLDPFGGNPLQQAIESLGDSKPDSLPIDDAIFKDDLPSAPLLLELLHNEPRHHTLMDLSISLAQEQARNTLGRYPICAWLFTNVSLKQLRVELRQRLDVRYPRERIYFRYFDPRVMFRLSQILTSTTCPDSTSSSSFADLLGPVKSWCQLDRDGRFIQHRKLQSNINPSARYLHFDEKIAAIIDRIELVNMTVGVLANRDMKCTKQDDERIDTQLAIAQKLGLIDVEDRVAYAWRAIAYGELFTVNNELKKWIEQAIKQSIPLDILLEKYFPLSDIGESCP